MKRVLLVEDDEHIRTMVATFLHMADFEVVTAGDGVEALLVTRKQPPDLILMDMGLPKLNGWQTIQRLRARHDTAAIPIIALTAYVMDEDRQRALAIGCNDFEVKPINFDRLLEKIRALLR